MGSEFKVKGRERWKAVMERAGYYELDAFFGRADLAHYCCLSCVYFTEDPKSPTGYWCKEFGFPDEPHGCSDGYKPLPELKD